ncbi:hypothetical protein L226DRAFT_137042 [Lentinus tigrinus ALCF2SS1-7]|uniref:uncharacterized protein n=1 Tax=Lentinus tigrinus ALCF2SS1-7 TaxID=1328758 RepID=UPI001165DF0C|nr:hypothetical protein L226DRAFT_137042 [Lentinus tigrinus ALCF2SS1-7]
MRLRCWRDNCCEHPVELPASRKLRYGETRPSSYHPRCRRYGCLSSQRPRLPSVVDAPTILDEEEFSSRGSDYDGVEFNRALPPESTFPDAKNPPVRPHDPAQPPIFLRTPFHPGLMTSLDDPTKARHPLLWGCRQSFQASTIGTGS